MITLLVDIDLLAIFHQLRLLEEIIYIFLIVATKLFIDSLIEIRQILRFCHLLTIVLHQSSQNLAIEIEIPCVAIILEVDILLLRILLIALQTDTVLHSHGPTAHLVVVSERLAEIHHCPHGIETLLIQTFKLVEI